MTKKDYILVAEVFQAHRKRYGGRTDAVVVEVIDDMADALGAENSRFDSARFIAACKG